MAVALGCSPARLVTIGVLAAIGATLALAACTDAETGSCRGTLVSGSSGRFCVYSPDDVSRAGGRIECAGDLPVRLEVSGGVVCAAGEVPPEDLPPAVCAELGGECRGEPPADAGPDTAPRDGGPDADAAADAGPPACRTPADCDDGVFCDGRERCAPGERGADPRGCVTDPACLPAMACDEVAGRCVTDCAGGGDADGDGHFALGCGGDDCDDARPEVNPRAAEVCDGVDQNCDGSIDEAAPCGDLLVCQDGACVPSDDWAVQLWAEVKAVALDPAGRVVAGGRVNTPDLFGGGADEGLAFVAVFETTGELAWYRRFGVNEALVSAIAVDGMGRVVAAGHFVDRLSSGHAGTDTRTSSADTFVATWEADVGDDGRVYAVVGTDGLTFAGEMVGGGGYSDAALLAFERDGTPRWAAHLASEYRDRGSVAVGGGDVYLAGPFERTLDVDGGETLVPPGPQSFYVARFSTDGALAWAVPFGSADVRVGVQGLTVDLAGNPCLSGYYLDGTFSIGRYMLSWTPPNPGFVEGADAFAACLERGTGSVRWARGWGGPWHESGVALRTAPGGELLVAGGFFESLTLDGFTATSSVMGATPCAPSYFAWLDAGTGRLTRGLQFSEDSCARAEQIDVGPTGTLAAVGSLAGLLELGTARTDSGRISRNFVLRYEP